jgi:hypothetical protein
MSTGSLATCRGLKIKDKEGKLELQILVSYCNAEELMFQSATPDFISSSEINLNLLQ